MDESKEKKENNTNSEEKKTKVRQATMELESILGVVTLLALRSQNHRFLFTSDLEWLVMPPIALKQFRIFRQEKQNAAIAFVSWAAINETIEKRLLSGAVKLAPKEWNSGNRLWIIDVISPFTKAENILKQLAENEFKNKDINILQPKKEGRGFEGKALKEILTTK